MHSTSSDIILMALFSLSMKAWIIIAVWFLLAPIAQKYDVGPLYVSNLFSVPETQPIIISDITLCSS